MVPAAELRSRRVGADGGAPGRAPACRRGNADRRTGGRPHRGAAAIRRQHLAQDPVARWRCKRQQFRQPRAQDVQRSQQRHLANGDARDAEHLRKFDAQDGEAAVGRDPSARLEPGRHDLRDGGESAAGAARPDRPCHRLRRVPAVAARGSARPLHPRRRRRRHPTHHACHRRGRRPSSAAISSRRRR